MASASTAAPSWTDLKEQLATSPTAKALDEQVKQLALGAGKADSNAKLRLFGHQESEVRLTLYRDHAGWCPYCQKVSRWRSPSIGRRDISQGACAIGTNSLGPIQDIYLRLKRITRLLPVIEIDGKMVTESLVIMQ
eukprot:3732366-Pyramimonas_sp.AAC.1